MTSAPEAGACILCQACLYGSQVCKRFTACICSREGTKQLDAKRPHTIQVIQLQFPSLSIVELLLRLGMPFQQLQSRFAERLAAFLLMHEHLANAKAGKWDMLLAPS